MAKYEVIIGESLSHCLIIEADTEEQALQQADWLLSFKSREYLEENFEYSIEAQYNGYDYVYEREMTNG